MSNRLYHIYYAFIMFLFIQACDTNKPIDRNAVKEEMANRELKRIPDSDIMEKGLELGNEIAISAQADLQKALLTAIKENGIAEAVKYCNANALDIVNDLEDSMGVTVYRVSGKYRNPKDEPDSLEALILDAYHYNMENEIQLDPTVQEENAQVLLYTKPIMLNKTICLQCHGKVGDEITTSDYEVIRQLYPADSAINYKLGQLRGMWSIRIPKKEIIKML